VFHLYRACRIEALADRLVDALRAQRPADPFAPITIAVGSRGMERWLRNRLAIGLEISANICFPFPHQALAQIYGGAADGDDPWAPDSLAWRILELLPHIWTLDECASLRDWMQRPRPQGVVERVGADVVDPDLWALAREIADVLDRAALFRPDWTEAWASGRPVAEAPAWQGVLWRQLCAAIPVRHPVALLSGRPQQGEPLFVFAISSMAPVWLHGLRQVGEMREVHVFLLTPSQEYWGDTRTRGELRKLDATMALRALEQQNPMLTAFGALARDTAEAYVALADIDDEEVPNGFDVPRDDTALGMLQSDIIAARARSEIIGLRDKRTLRMDDDSLQFHDCHGATRQVEALRESLLALFDARPEIQPRDVVVMTPDIATYAPLVRAIFAEGRDEYAKVDGWGLLGAPRIPTYIADLGIRELNPLAEVLLRVLAFADGRLGAPALADFVALDPVRRKHGLDDDDVARVRGWLADAGARLGSDAADRERTGLPPQHAFTLAFALDRLALGVALADDGVASFAGVAPFDEMEGDAAQAFGPFAELCARLEHWRTTLRAPRPMEAWLPALLDAVDDLAMLSAKVSYLRVELAEALATLKAEASSFQGDVTLPALMRILSSRLERSGGGDRLTSGAVTVCALAPMRSVPFQVICLLGMDDAAFPRGHRPRAFDAVGTQPRPGDRNPRDEDRNLLLESLLSARAHLLVFYSGRDPRTDKALAPAVPIGDVLDVVDLTLGLPADTPADLDGVQPVLPRHLLTRVHRVQPFVGSGFRAQTTAIGRPVPRRFDGRMYTAASALAAERTGGMPLMAEGLRLPDPQPPTSLTIDALTRWLRRPVRTMMRERLGLYLDDPQRDLPEREAMELGALEASGVGRLAVDAVKRGAVDASMVIDRLAQRAIVPPGAPGRAVASESWAAARAAFEAASGCFPGGVPEPVRREIRVPVRGDGFEVLLTGTAFTHADAFVVVVHDSPQHAKSLIPAWVILLGLRASGHPVSHAIIAGAETKDDAEVGVCVLLDVPEDTGKALATLVGIVMEARQTVLPIVDRTSFCWALTAFKPGFDGLSDEEKFKRLCVARQDAAKKWQPSQPGSYAERDDRALALAFAGEPPYGSDSLRASAAFEDAATRLWKPILDARRP
jgi:exodeoxyribonuclease V gamma subunit